MRPGETGGSDTCQARLCAASQEEDRACPESSLTHQIVTPRTDPGVIVHDINLRKAPDWKRMPFLLLVLVLVSTARAEAVTIRSVADALDRGVVTTIAGEQLCSNGSLPAFYRSHGFRPVWTGSSSAQLVRALERAEEDGLRPEDYHLARVRALRTDAHRIEELDLLLTDAFLLFGSHLLNGKVDPKRLTPTWCLQPRAGDVVAALDTALEMNDVEAVLDKLRPPGTAYRELRRMLTRYRAAAERGGWTTVGSGPAMKLGQAGERVDRLAHRLSQTGDGAHETWPAFFDQNMHDAVIRFQSRHGLDADGVVGPATIRALDVPIEERIEELELNLERLRWLPDPGRRYAMINIAAFRLWVVDEGNEVLNMRVVVGKPFQKTPVFSSEIRQVVFSPYWNIPASIARNEIWPRARREPGYLAREHIEIVPGGGLRQRPGPWNALGGVKFIAPNDHGVYLHDTPAKALFARSSRAFSHGCMRIERPLDFAAFLLKGDPEWTDSTMQAASTAGVERHVRISRPLPLHVLYWTAWVDVEGRLQLRDDVYGRNAALSGALHERVGRARP